MKSGLKSATLAYLLIAVLSACGGGGGGDVNPPFLLARKWTWVSGSNTINQIGIYGLQGTADPSNVPGARCVAVSWTDPQGELWLFGGWGSDSVGVFGWLNDLWKYNPATFEWTWVSGSSAANQVGIYGTKGTGNASNVPGCRVEAVSWIDPQGKFWLFGGYGYDSSGNVWFLNDLWKYDPTTLEWTWVSGSNIVGQNGIYGTQGTASASNVPGARAWAVSWIDSSGKLWLFGGYGYDSSGYLNWLNDLWTYDLVTLEWTWVSGSDIGDQAGTYGTKGMAAPGNVPGAREMAVSWIDSSGKLWLFGGYGYYSEAHRDNLNDLWKYDPATFEWTWVSGSSVPDQVAIYGKKGIADPLNVPGARQLAVSWPDSSSILWLFGGSGYDSAGNFGKLNDLWKFDLTTLEWSWVFGSNIVDQTGTYGTKGTATSANVPGARDKAVTWVDSAGQLWLFGGSGYDSTGGAGFLNDLWRYTR